MLWLYITRHHPTGWEWRNPLSACHTLICYLRDRSVPTVQGSGQDINPQAPRSTFQTRSLCDYEPNVKFSTWGGVTLPCTTALLQISSNRVQLLGNPPQGRSVGRAGLGTAHPPLLCMVWALLVSPREGCSVKRAAGASRSCLSGLTPGARAAESTEGSGPRAARLQAQDGFALSHRLQARVTAKAPDQRSFVSPHSSLLSLITSDN